jgi:hypothetical protein
MKKFKVQLFKLLNFFKLVLNDWCSTNVNWTLFGWIWFSKKKCFRWWVWRLDLTPMNVSPRQTLADPGSEGSWRKSAYSRPSFFFQKKRSKKSPHLRVHLPCGIRTFEWLHAKRKNFLLIISWEGTGDKIQRGSILSQAYILRGQKNSYVIHTFLMFQLKKEDYYYTTRSILCILDPLNPSPWRSFWNEISFSNKITKPWSLGEKEKKSYWKTKKSKKENLSK